MQGQGLQSLQKGSLQIGSSALQQMHLPRWRQPKPRPQERPPERQPPQPPQPPQLPQHQPPHQ
jgi:hypothetical protein